jgi:Tfp pilus assembly protein PilE
MRTACWIALVVAVVGCKKESASPTASPGAPASTAEVDALWKLAPEGANFGMVVSPRGMTLVEHAWGDVMKFLEATPDLAPQLAEMRAELTKQIGAGEFSWQALGVSTQKGAAVFALAGHKGVVLVSVADQAKLDKLIHANGTSDMTCKTVQGMYACSDDPAAFDRIGKGSLSATAANARGDFEIAGKDLPIGGNDHASFAGVAQLAPGAVTLRGAFTGLPAPALAMFGPATKPRTDGDNTTGFALAHVAEVMKMMPPLPGEMGAVVKTFQDPVTLVTTSTAIDLRVPLGDPAPATRALIAHCTEGPMAELGAKLVDGACQFSVPNLPQLTVSVWVDGNTLRVGQKGAPSPAAVEPTELGKELATHDWQVAFYGRGSLLANYPGSQVPELGGDAAAIINVAMRAMAMVNEVGTAVKVDGATLRFVLGVRTAWSNPDAVVTKLLALDAKQLIAGKGGDLAKPIIASAPDSPLAKDVKAGYMGLMIPSAGVGILAAVAIPAFLDYQKHTKPTRVSLELNRLGKNLKAYYIESSAFPIGDAPLTPDKTCCGQPSNKCAVDPAMFTGVWQKVDFQLDEPTSYRFSYHSDGKTVEISAVGDLDCDGQEATYKLEVAAPNGNPTAAIAPPASGVY